MPEQPVSRPATAHEIRGHLAGYDFEAPAPARSVIQDAVDMLSRWTVHTAHPAYFGLFNAAPVFLGVLGELLAAGFNPQLAAWSHAPAANEIERHLVRFMADRLGLGANRACGTFTTGGAEANLTALLVALTRAHPEVSKGGVRALGGHPVFYPSEQSHLAWLNIAHASGLGRDAARLVPVGPDLRMDTARLRQLVREDRVVGHLPFLVVATAGTTSAGIIDPLPELVSLSRELEVQLHVDAAWAGAAALSDELRPILEGIADADSGTVDAHKWLSMPMGAGDVRRHRPAGAAGDLPGLHGYMPWGVEDASDPYVHSVQWSRHAIGLKLFLTLAAVGREGYAPQLEHDSRLGDMLRERLSTAGWRVVNDTPLPARLLHRRRSHRARGGGLTPTTRRSRAAWLRTGGPGSRRTHRQPHGAARVRDELPHAQLRRRRARRRAGRRP